MTRIGVDWTRCDGHGACAELLPDVLALDEWGYPLALDGSSEPAVPRAAVRRAERAVAACPLAALRAL
jgi:ferredoxin